MIKPIPTRTPLRSRATAWLADLAADMVKGAGMLHNALTGGLL
jgi:hypothetical protein